MAQNEFTRSAAPDGIHENIEFNEYRSAEWNARRWEKRMRRQLVMEKVMPFGIVVGTLLAFLILGYIEVGL